MTARAEVPAFAGERQQVLVRTGVAADAREAVLEDPAREELVGNLSDDRTPRAVRAGEAVVVDGLPPMQMIRHQPKERRRLGAPGPVDALYRWRRVCHARSVTVERRA